MSCPSMSGGDGGVDDPPRPLASRHALHDRPAEPVAWGPSAVAERAQRTRTRGVCELLSKAQRRRTPRAFAEWLVSLARSVRNP
jgi:hypothetical protein